MHTSHKAAQREYTDTLRPGLMWSASFRQRCSFSPFRDVVCARTGAPMSKRVYSLIALALLLAPCGLAKDKKKGLLPIYIMQARTVAVIVDPDAGVSMSAPQANRIAQKDVETALLNWGRFEPVMDTGTADLLIVIRKGSGKLVDATVTDPRQNSRRGYIDPTDDGVAIGAQQKRSADPSNLPDAPTQARSHPQTEIGNTDDSFVVYDGKIEDPLDASAGWRYVAKDGLRAHTVPAVEEFRKALAEAEKAATKKP